MCWISIRFCSEKQILFYTGCQVAITEIEREPICRDQPATQAEVQLASVPVEIVFYKFSGSVVVELQDLPVVVLTKSSRGF